MINNEVRFEELIYTDNGSSFEIYIGYNTLLYSYNKWLLILLIINFLKKPTSKSFLISINKSIFKLNKCYFIFAGHFSLLLLSMTIVLNKKTCLLIDCKVTVIPQRGKPVNFSFDDLFIFTAVMKYIWDVNKSVLKYYRFGN